MRCERLLVFLLLIAACSRESSAPEPPDPTPPRDLTTASAPSTTAPVQPVPAPPTSGTYDKGLIWLRSAPKFSFVLDEGDVHAEGRMSRETVGAETVEVKVNGEEWRAKSGVQGVTWERRAGGKWAPAAVPLWGNRVYQRVTLAFDPQKKEGEAQLAGSEGTSNHYRFTNANTGEVHEVWVAQSDNHIARIKIGNAFEMKITP